MKLLKKSPKQVQFESESLTEAEIASEAGFEKLFYLYCQPLINFACRYVKDTPIAENIVQEVFLKIWQNCCQFESASNIKTYLYTAVKNQALKQLRHDDVRRRSVETLKACDPPAKTPEDVWHEKEIAEAVHLAIDELPEKCRIIFSMNRFDNLTYAEIAEIQNISIKTVETQMGRALKFLRKRLVHFLLAFPL